MKFDAEKMAALAERIVRYRAKFDLNQGEFAARCGLTKQTIYAVETGRNNITKLTFAKINNILESEGF